eukprot:2343020-Amphidinium_carterae.2
MSELLNVQWERLGLQTLVSVSCTRFFMKALGLSWRLSRIFNLDETAVRLTPVSERGLREKNKDAVKPGETGLVTMVAIVMPNLASKVAAQE